MQVSSRSAGGSARRRARQVALQVLYAVDVGTDRPRRLADRAAAASTSGAQPPVEFCASAGRPDTDAVFETVSAHFEMPGAARAFARELALGVRGDIDAIDARVAAHARNWRLDRMAVVDRNILRLATWELLRTDTPTAVVLDEAIDLAQRFADDPSPAFVNGILDAIARDVREPSS